MAQMQLAHSMALHTNNKLIIPKGTIRAVEYYQVLSSVNLPNMDISLIKDTQNGNFTFHRIINRHWQLVREPPSLDAPVHHPPNTIDHHV